MTRYPATDRAEDAKRRLQAMHRPVPTPTQEALAQNKAEMASRGKMGMISGLWLNFHKRPDISQAARAGEPTLVDPKPTDAAELVRHATDIASGKASNKVSVEAVKDGAPAANEPTPRSEGNDPDAIPELKPLPEGGSADSSSSAPPAAAPQQVNDAAAPEAQAVSPAGSGDPQNVSSSKTKREGSAALNPF